MGTPRWVALLLLGVIMTMQASQVLGQVNFGATLTVLSGRVSVVRSNGSAIQPASTGITLNVGDRVATVGRSSALVTFFDGSEIELGADTTISIGDASREADDVITFLIEVVLGGTVHRVSTLKNPDSTYKIVAGNSVIEVRGTTVGVGVNDEQDVTAFLKEGTASFDGKPLQPGTACTLDSNGRLACSNRQGQDPLSVVTTGVAAGESKGNNSLSNTPKSDDDKNKEPPPESSPEPAGRQP